MDLQLRRLRKSEGLSQGELAAKLGTTLRKVSSWERGETPIPLEDACAAADYFAVSLDELAGRSSPRREYADKRQAAINEIYGYLDDANRAAALGAMRGIAAAQAEKKTEDKRIDVSA